jgi:hypothetical protein
MSWDIYADHLHQVLPSSNLAPEDTKITLRIHGFHIFQHYKTTLISQPQFGEIFKNERILARKKFTNMIICQKNGLHVLSTTNHTLG